MAAANQPEANFMVTFSDVFAENLAAAVDKPYLKVVFDVAYKVFDTDYVKREPQEWPKTFPATFHYATRFPQPECLQRKFCVIECWDHNTFTRDGQHLSHHP